MLEVMKVPDRAEQRFLHQILGIGEVTRVAGQPAGGPSAETRPIALDQAIERGLVTALGESDELDRGFGVHLRWTHDNKGAPCALPGLWSRGGRAWACP